jgi:alkanesulfonate monooxygenase
MKTAEQVDAVKLRMVAPGLVQDLPDAECGLGIHLGVIARETSDAAWQAANERFPHDPDMEGLLEFVMEGSDSVWKQKLYEQTMARDDRAPEFWLEPFRQLRADCPYLVGSHDRLAEIFAEHIAKGVDWFVFDLPDNRAEFENTAICIERALAMVGAERANAFD